MLSIDGDFDGGQDGRLNEHEVGVVGKTTEEPDEGLLKLVVALGRDVVILQVLLAVEGDLLGLHLAVFNIDLVADEHNGDVFADSG